MAVIGSAFVLLSWVLYRHRGIEPHWSEPALFVSLTAGASFWYPGLLARPIFLPSQQIPAWVALVLIGGVAVALTVASTRKGTRAQLAALMLLIGVC